MNLKNFAVRVAFINLLIYLDLLGLYSWKLSFICFFKLTLFIFYLFFVFKQKISAYLLFILLLQFFWESSLYLFLFDFYILLVYLFTQWKTVPTNKMSTLEFFGWFNFNQESFLVNEITVSNVKSLTTKKARLVFFLINSQLIVLLEVSYKIFRLISSGFFRVIWLLSDIFMLLVVNLFEP